MKPESEDTETDNPNNKPENTSDEVLVLNFDEDSNDELTPTNVKQEKMNETTEKMDTTEEKDTNVKIKNEPGEENKSDDEDSADGLAGVKIHGVMSVADSHKAGPSKSAEPEVEPDPEPEPQDEPASKTQADPETEPPETESLETESPDAESPETESPETETPEAGPSTSSTATDLIECKECNYKTTDESHFKQHLAECHLNDVPDMGQFLEVEQQDNDINDQSTLDLPQFPAELRPFELEELTRVQNEKTVYGCPVKDCTYTTIKELFLEKHLKMKSKKDKAHKKKLKRYLKKKETDDPDFVKDEKEEPKPKLLGPGRPSLSKLMKCPKCTFTTYYKSVYMNHLNVNRDVEKCVNQVQTQPKAAKKYPCPKCSYVGAQGPHLKSHMLTHEAGETLEKCPNCDYISTKYQLARHTRECLKQNAGEYKCLWCDYVAKDPTYLKYHVVQHENGEPVVQCHYCDWKSTKRMVGQHHRQVHAKDHFKKIRNTGVNTKLNFTSAHRYKCNQCSFAAKREYTMNLHVFVTHKQQKQPVFQCPYCPIRYIRRLLSQHINRDHVDIVEDQRDKEENEYVCPKCDHRERCRELFQKHLMDNDMGCISLTDQAETLTSAGYYDSKAKKKNSGEQYPCDRCSFVAPNQQAIYKHNFLHAANEPILECPDCDYRTTKAQLNKHRTAEHGYHWTKEEERKKKEREEKKKQLREARKAKGEEISSSSDSDDSDDDGLVKNDLQLEDNLIITERIDPQGQPYKYYQCGLCSYGYHSKSNIEIHFFQHVRGDKIFDCPFCDFKSTKKSVTLHKSKVHKGLMAIPFDEKQIYYCEKCKFGTRSLKVLESHVEINKHLPMCADGLQNFSESLYSRLADENVGEEKGANSQKKDDNDESGEFGAHFLMSQTMSVDGSPRVASARGVQEEPSTRINLEDFQKAIGLTERIVGHEAGVKGITKGGVVGVEVKQDRELESGRKVYYCTLCSFKTNGYQNLARHFLLHKQGHQMKQCPHCDFKSTQHATALHIRKSHPTFLGKPERSSMRYFCNKCDYRTTVLANLQNHMQRNKNRTVCTEGIKKKSYPLNPNREYTKTREIGDFSCHRCGFQTIYYTTLEHHILKNRGREECWKKHGVTANRRIREMRERKRAGSKVLECLRCEFKTGTFKCLVAHVQSQRKYPECLPQPEYCWARKQEKIQKLLEEEQSIKLENKDKDSKTTTKDDTEKDKDEPENKEDKSGTTENTNDKLDSEENSIDKPQDEENDVEKSSVCEDTEVEKSVDNAESTENPLEGNEQTQKTKISVVNIANLKHPEPMDVGETEGQTKENNSEKTATVQSSTDKESEKMEEDSLNKKKTDETESHDVEENDEASKTSEATDDVEPTENKDAQTDKTVHKPITVKTELEGGESKDSVKKEPYTITETGQRLWNCRFCDYTTYQSGSILGHSLAHGSNEPILDCSECDFRATKSAVIKHRVRAHGILENTGLDKEEADFEQKLEKCQFCDYTCNSKAQMFNHTSLHDLGKPTLKCSYCDFKTTRYALYLHRRSAHGIAGKDTERHQKKRISMGHDPNMKSILKHIIDENTEKEDLEAVKTILATAETVNSDDDENDNSQSEIPRKLRNRRSVVTYKEPDENDICEVPLPNMAPLQPPSAKRNGVKSKKPVGAAADSSSDSSDSSDSDDSDGDIGGGDLDDDVDDVTDDVSQNTVVASKTSEDDGPPLLFPEDTNFSASSTNDNTNDSDYAPSLWSQDSQEEKRKPKKFDPNDEKCTLCDFMGKKQAMGNHMAQHKYKRVEVCPFCPYKYLGPSALYDHKKLMHPDKIRSYNKTGKYAYNYNPVKIEPKTESVSSRRSDKMPNLTNVKTEKDKKPTDAGLERELLKKFNIKTDCSVDLSDWVVPEGTTGPVKVGKNTSYDDQELYKPAILTGKLAAQKINCLKCAYVATSQEDLQSHAIIHNFKITTPPKNQFVAKKKTAVAQKITPSARKKTAVPQNTESTPKLSAPQKAAPQRTSSSRKRRSPSFDEDVLQLDEVEEEGPKKKSAKFLDPVMPPTKIMEDSQSININEVKIYKYNIQVNGKNISVNIYQCNQCDYETNKFYQLLSHQRVHKDKDAANRSIDSGVPSSRSSISESSLKHELKPEGDFDSDGSDLEHLLDYIDTNVKPQNGPPPSGKKSDKSKQKDAKTEEAVIVLNSDSESESSGSTNKQSAPKAAPIRPKTEPQLPFACQECPFATDNRMSFSNHLRRHPDHPSPILECSCGFKKENLTHPGLKEHQSRSGCGGELVVTYNRPEPPKLSSKRSRSPEIDLSEMKKPKEIKKEKVDEIQVLKCRTCPFKTLNRSRFDQHNTAGCPNAKPASPAGGSRKSTGPAEKSKEAEVSVIQVMNCDNCSFRTLNKTKFEEHKSSCKPSRTSSPALSKKSAEVKKRSDSPVVIEDVQEVEVLSCKHCSFKTLNQTKFNQHQETCKNKNKPAPVAEKVFKCPACFYKAKVKSNLDRHYEQCHTECSDDE